MNEENIEALLKDYQCPYMGTDLVSTIRLKKLMLMETTSMLNVLGWPAEGIMQAFHENMDKKLKRLILMRKPI